MPNTFKDLMVLAGKTGGKILTRLRIDEVSSVDRGAGEGVHVTLMKRADDDEPYWKREFSADDRKRDAKSGAAEPDGSFPIHNATDLHNAMDAIGRSKNPAKTKAHIRARARALGLTDELSDAFKRADMQLDPLKLANTFAGIFGKSQPKIPEEINSAVVALAKSVASIDATDPEERAKLLSKTFEQFSAHINKLPVIAEKRSDGDNKGDDKMSLAVLKALGLKEGASEEEMLKAIAARQDALEKAEADFDDDEDAEDDNEKDPEKKKAFRAMTHEQRKAYLAKKYPKSTNPEMDALKKRADDQAAEIALLKADRELADIKKIAVDAGMADVEAATIQKAYKGDREAVDRLVSAVKAANAQAKTAGVWKEFGATGGDKVGTTALDQLNALASELKKKDPKLTQEQAFAKVFSDPANHELAARERAENSPRAA